MRESNPVYTNQNHIKNMDTKMKCNESLTTVSYSAGKLCPYIPMNTACNKPAIHTALQTKHTPMAQTQLNDIDSPSWTMCAAAPQRVAQEHPKERDREMKVPILP